MCLKVLKINDVYMTIQHAAFYECAMNKVETIKFPYALKKSSSKLITR